MVISSLLQLPSPTEPFQSPAGQDSSRAPYIRLGHFTAIHGRSFRAEPRVLIWKACRAASGTSAPSHAGGTSHPAPPATLSALALSAGKLLPRWPLESGRCLPWAWSALPSAVNWAVGARAAPGARRGEIGGLSGPGSGTLGRPADRRAAPVRRRILFSILRRLYRADGLYREAVQRRGSGTARHADPRLTSETTLTRDRLQRPL